MISSDNLCTDVTLSARLSYCPGTQGGAQSVLRKINFRPLSRVVSSVGHRLQVLAMGEAAQQHSARYTVTVVRHQLSRSGAAWQVLLTDTKHRQPFAELIDSPFPQSAGPDTQRLSHSLNTRFNDSACGYGTRWIAPLTKRIHLARSHPFAGSSRAERPLMRAVHNGA